MGQNERVREGGRYLGLQIIVVQGDHGVGVGSGWSGTVQVRCGKWGWGGEGVLVRESPRCQVELCVALSILPELKGGEEG